jgi:DNA-binding MarR family transcriptional regulator
VRIPSTADRRSVLVSLTDGGRSLASEVATRFEADVWMVLDCLRPSDRAALSRVVSRVLVAHATDHGIDLFATVGARPRPGVGD